MRVPSIKTLQNAQPYVFEVDDAVTVQGIAGEWYEGLVKGYKISLREEEYVILYEVNYRGNCKRWFCPLDGTIKPSYGDPPPRWLY